MKEGLIDAGQAARIEDAETARAQPPAPVPAPVPAGSQGTGTPAAGTPAAGTPAAGTPAAGTPAPAPAPRRAPLVVEALGYAGGALAIVAGVVAVNQLWPDIPVSGQLAFAAAGTAGLGLAAALLATGKEPALCRLRSVLWFLSTACLVAFVALLTSQVWGFSPLNAALTTTAVATVYAGVLWWLNRTPLQHLAMFAGMATTVGYAVAVAWPGGQRWAPGLAVWLLSATWGAAVYRGYLVPRDTGYAAAGVGLLAGAQVMMHIAAGHVIAWLTVAGLLTAGVVLRRLPLLILGTLGILLVVPQTAGRYLPQQIAAPLAVFIAGLALLGVALWLAGTRRRRPKSG